MNPALGYHMQMPFVFIQIRSVFIFRLSGFITNGRYQFKKKKIFSLFLKSCVLVFLLLKDMLMEVFG